jgi:hypothetical protein
MVCRGRKEGKESFCPDGVRKGSSFSSHQIRIMSKFLCKKLKEKRKNITKKY